MSDKTTPRPWRRAGTIIQWHADADGREESMMVCCVTGDGSTSEDDANAELIVRAVNSHDELLAAAKRLVAVATEDKPEQWAEAVYALEAAIAKAEGRT